MNTSNTLISRGLLFSLGMLALPFAGLAQSGNQTIANDLAKESRRHEPRNAPDAVYTISNGADANRVLTFSRNAGGELQPSGDYPTGGKGTGGGLGNQGALALTKDGRWLVVVNAGSNDISVFSVREDALVLTDSAPSGGKRPISVTVADNLIYVLNAGGAAGAADNISGFLLSERGRLYALPGSTRPLTAASVAPAQISFGLHDDVLIVTEKATSTVDSFVVDDNGQAGQLTATPSSGSTPFGFAISSNGSLFISEAVASALSSYRIHPNGALQPVTKSLVNKQTAACWVALSKDGEYAYTANAVSNTISGYRVNHHGNLSLLNTTGVTAVTDDHPLDLAVSKNGRFLYSLNTASKTIVGFRIAEDGSLVRVSAVGGLPAGGSGLVAR